MQPIVAERPYQFVPPYRGNFWPGFLKLFVGRFLARSFGVTEVEIRDAHRLEALLESGQSVLLTANHSRMADPLVLEMLSKRVRRHFYIMASSHLFYRGRFQAWVLRRAGAFSVHREGVDREAVNAAVEILAEGTRPLVIFPEGCLSHANDRLNALMPGVSFIARTAARRVEKRSDGHSAGQVVALPVAIKYLFRGDLERTVLPMLEEIERRLSWRPQRQLTLYERIYKLGHALLTVKELEYFEAAQNGELHERTSRLSDHILGPLESKWLERPSDGSVIRRVKELRKAVLPGIIEGDLSREEREGRWRDLEDMYLAQQLSLYPPRYVASRPTADRILETVERFAEDLTDDEQFHGPTTAVIQLGEPVEVESRRRRDADGDPVLRAIEEQLETMLEKLASESRIHADGSK